jgi:translation initiation factor 2 subunit 2
MDYEKLLERAKEKSSKSGKGSRFEPPEPEVMKEGNKTILKNLSQIGDKLRRSKEHLMKFFRKELAVPGEIDGSRAIFQGTFSQRQIEDKLDQYIEEFVLCPACDKADTELVKEERITKIKCEACGTKQAVRKI